MAAFEIVALDEATPQLRAPGSADTYLAPRALALTPVSLTGSAATSSLSIAQTWNTSGTPTAFDLNVTDTASNASSLLMNLRTGGTSRFRVTKLGAVTTDGAVTTGGSITVGGNVNIPSFANSFNWGSDIRLVGDAANTLALRNGTNAQTSRVYGTFTDASNGRWLNISMTTAGVATITPTGNGTGASGNVVHISGLPTSNPGPGILWNNAGTPAIGT